MKLSRRTEVSLLVTSTLAAACAAGCGDEYQRRTDDGAAGTLAGGATGTGGVDERGGADAGGTVNATKTGEAGGGTFSTTQPSAGVGAAGASSQATGGASTGTTVAITCGTTPATIPSEIATFTCGKAGFDLNRGASANTNAEFIVTTTSPAGGPRDLCANGCGVLTLPFLNGDKAWDKGAIVDKQFESTTSLVGARIVARVAIRNPSNTPIQFKLFAQSGIPDWLMAERAIVDTTEYALASGAKDYEYVVVDKIISKKQFCATDVVRYGLQVQTSGLVTEETAGSVAVYMQSISLISPAESVGAAGAAGGGGCPGSSAGAAGSPAGT